MGCNRTYCISYPDFRSNHAGWSNRSESTGIQIKAPAQLAALLVPFLGKASNIVMGVALLGAGFSSLLGNTQRGMVLLSAGFDKDVALESKLIRWGCMITLALHV